MGAAILVSLALALGAPATSQGRNDGVWESGVMVMIEEIAESPASKYMHQQEYGPKCEPLFVKVSEVMLQNASFEDLKSLMMQTGEYYCDHTLMVSIMGELAENRIDEAVVLSNAQILLSLAATSVRPMFSGADNLVMLAFAEWVRDDRDRSAEALCTAKRTGNKTANAIVAKWPTPLPCSSTAPGKPATPAPKAAPAPKTAPAPVKPQPTPPPVTAKPPPPPPPPPPPAVTVKPAPAPPPPPAQQRSIEAVTSPAPGYTHCRRIPLDYYDPDGKLVSESMLMCRDRNGEFIEVTGTQ